MVMRLREQHSSAAKKSYRITTKSIHIWDEKPIHKIFWSKGQDSFVKNPTAIISEARLFGVDCIYTH